MSNQYQLYLSLLRAAIWNDKVGTDERINGLTGERVNDVIRLAAFQGTGPLVFDQLLKLKNVEIPAALRIQMKQQCMASMMQQNVMLPILNRAWHSLENANIHPVLLKGSGLAQYYPQPHLRQWGDIDLYVGQRNYHLGCETLRAAFPGVKHMVEEGDDYKHYNFEFGNTVLEMHRVSMTFYHYKDRHYYEQLEAAYLTKDGPSFELNGLCVVVPEDTFNVFFVFLHAWHHFTETGMNMKQLCDVAVLLYAKREVIDIERLREMLTKLHLMEVWQLFMYILVQHMGLSQVEAPFYTEQCKKRADALLERVMQEGSARIHIKLNTEGVSYLKRKWLTFQLRMADVRLVKPYAPRYAHHMAVSAIFHGIERIIQKK